MKNRSPEVRKARARAKARRALNAWRQKRMTNRKASETNRLWQRWKLGHGPGCDWCQHHPVLFRRQPSDGTPF